MHYSRCDPDSTLIEEITAATKALALELGVVGLMNVQYAIKDGRLFVLEVNPRASRTVPFVSKAIGLPLAGIAARAMIGRPLKDLGLTRGIAPAHIAVKEAVFPFNRLPDVDTLLGPEMKSTGEVMGIDSDFGAAYAKAQIGAGLKLPTNGTVFVSVKDGDKKAAFSVASQFKDMGFNILATKGTGDFLEERGISSIRINKVSAGRPHVVDAIKNGEIQMIINTGSGDKSRQDGFMIRRAAIKYDIPYATTIAGAKAMCRGIAALRTGSLPVRTIQEYVGGLSTMGIRALQ